MRRLLALILALTVFSSCMAVVAETADTDSFEVIDSEAFEALKYMGLLTNDFLSIDAGSAVTRAQFLGALYKLTGITDGGFDVEHPFSDVNSETPHKNAIEYFYAIGVVNGTESNTFEPDSQITYIQAVKIITDFLGYRPYVQECPGEYPAGYITTAKRLDLSMGITVADINAPISAEAAIRLIYNAANTPVFEGRVYNEKGEITRYSVNEDITPLTAYHNIMYAEGILQDNGIVSLTGDESNEGTIIIGKNKYKRGEFDLTDYLGMEIQFFYKSEGSIKTVLWAYADSRNNTLVIKSEILNTDDSAYGFTNIVYWENDRRQTAVVEDFADIVYNNVLCNNPPLEYIKPKSGEIKLINNDGDGSYDLVVVKEYSNIYAEAVSETRNFVSNKYGETLDLEQYESVKLFDISGAPITINELSPGRVLSYIAHPENKQYIHIYENADGVTATLDSKVEDGADSIYKFDGVDMKLSQSLIDAISNGKYYVPEVTVGKKYTYFTDIDGKIAAIKGDITDEQYAYFIRAAQNRDVFAPQNSYKIELLLADGIVTTASTADGFQFTGYDDGVSILDKGAQVVKATFNNDGELKTLEFATPLDRDVYPNGFNRDEFTLDYAPSKAHNRYGVFNGTCAIDGNTLIFATIVTDFGEPQYQVIGSSGIFEEKTYSSVTRGSITYPGARFYDVDEYMHAGVLSISIQYGGYVNTTSNLLVDEIINCIDDEGNEYVKITGIRSGNESSLTILDPRLVPDGLKRGDVVSVSEVNHAIHRVQKTYSFSDSEYQHVDTTEGEGGGAASWALASGYLYSNDGQRINIYHPKGYNNGKKVLVTSTNGNYSLRVGVYDAKNDRVYAGKINELYQNCTPQADGTLEINDSSTRVFISRRIAYAADVIVGYY